MTSNERPADRWERLRPRNWSLAFKLIAVLVVPVLLAQALLVLRIVEQVNQADRLGGNDRYMAVQDRVSSAVGQLQRERDESVRFIAGGRAGDRSAQKAVFGATDTSIAEARTAIGDPATLGGAGEAFRVTQEALGKLPALRSQVTDSQAPVMDVLTQYTAIVAPLIRLESAVGDQFRPAEPSNLVATLQSLSVVGEQNILQHAVISAAIIGRQVTPQQADLVRAADVRLASTVDELNATLTPDQRARYAAFVASQDYAKREQLKNVALSRAGAPASNADTTTTNPVSQAPPAALLPTLADWDAANEGVLTALRGAQGTVRSDLRALNAAQQENAKNLAGIYSVILLLATVLGTTLLVLVWRTLLKSLRTLRGTALDVAQRKLPQALQSMREGEVPDVSVEPVPVTTSEEIGQVARAFDAVHSQAVRLAAEQATLQAGVSSMFVNLSRRSQGLVERQLQLIEQLESNEQDSDQLANLFQLDHLATRMRRNSESLLVLAGSEANRRAGQPVPVIDVLRAAVSEVEQYQRIVVQPPPPVKILGRTAADLVHLLAELLDNATNFSAPDTQVVMSSTRTEDGSVLIEIADRGVGMAPNELAEANDRLSGPTTVDVSASRRMGLFVVGRLASRHGIGVRLGGPPSTAAAGVTASVSVPSYLVPLAEGTGEDARVGAGASMPDEQMAGNGASSAGSLQSFMAGGNSRSAPSSVGNGHGGTAPPDLPPQRAPMDRPLAQPPRLGPSLASSQPLQGRPQGPARGDQSEPGQGRAPIDTGQWNRTAGPGAPMAGQVTETTSPRQDTPGSAQSPAGGRPAYGEPPADGSSPGMPLRTGPGSAGLRSAQGTAAPPMQPRDQGPPTSSTPPSSAGMFAPSVPATAEPPAATAAPPPPAQAPPSSPPPQLPTPPPAALAQPGVPRRPPLEAAVTERRDLSETTPIFEEIASAWFQSNRPVPVDWDTDGAGIGGATAGQRDEVAEQQPAAGAGTSTQQPRDRQPEQAGAAADTGKQDAQREPTPSQEQPPSAQPSTLDPALRAASSMRSSLPDAHAERPHAKEVEHTDAPDAASESVSQRAPEPEVVVERPLPAPEAGSMPVAHEAPPPPAARPAASLPIRQPEAALDSAPEQAPAVAVPGPAAATPSSLEFASAADEGWHAAQALESSVESESAEMTAAGLPKRKPRARLIPGSASAEVTPTTAGAPPRTADAVRGRLASYQEGVRQGREQRRRRGPDPANATTGGRPNEGHDEENR